VTTLFEQLKDPNIDRLLASRIETDLFKLLFPYENQQPYDGSDSGCTARIDAAARKVTLNVTPHGCALGSQCEKMLGDYLLNRVTPPWSDTHGVSQAVYGQQRAAVHDWNDCYCATAGASFNSSNCSCSKTPQMSDTNGGVCQSRAGKSGLGEPSVSSCVPLSIQDGLTVINGPQDLFIQWTYGKALVEAYQQAYGQGKANLVVYGGPDGAGHGVLVQHPRWVQEQIHAALQND
jgi:hypothetical protein